MYYKNVVVTVRIKVPNMTLVKPDRTHWSDVIQRAVQRHLSDATVSIVSVQADEVDTVEQVTRKDL